MTIDPRHEREQDGEVHAPLPGRVLPQRVQVGGVLRVPRRHQVRRVADQRGHAIYLGEQRALVIQRDPPTRHGAHAKRHAERRQRYA